MEPILVSSQRITAAEADDKGLRKSKVEEEKRKIEMRDRNDGRTWLGTKTKTRRPPLAPLSHSAQAVSECDCPLLVDSRNARFTVPDDTVKGTLLLLLPMGTRSKLSCRVSHSSDSSGFALAAA